MLGSCKKFLNVEPIDALSGNNYWKNKDDAETFTREIYRLFRLGVGINYPLHFIADTRNAPVLRTSNAAFVNYRRDIDMISQGKIKDLVNTARVQDADRYWQRHMEYDIVGNWAPIYKVIQSANILYELVPKVAENDPTFSPAEVKKYQAEAVFMRCLTYLYLIRLYGDVPYYTNAYNQDALPRTLHTQVAKNCLAELAKVKDDLPWTYDEPADRSVRAMRGSAIALMMHFNMWLAGFEPAVKDDCYAAVDQLGDELWNEGVVEQGAYELLPLNQVSTIFIGRSKEGLFEIPTNVNYGESYGQFIRKQYWANVLHWPYFILNPGFSQSGQQASELAYETSYMKTLYPEDVNDGRKDFFVDKGLSNTQTIYSGDYHFTNFKFFNLALGTNNNGSTVSLSSVVFRLADAILLQAEADAELGYEDKAITLLNRIRSRANALPYPGSNNYDNNLKDAIYWERCKELMGEGHYYWDLVRTKKILDGKYCWHPMSYSAYLQEAWTWPIDKSALTNNPFMTLNNYWN